MIYYHLSFVFSHIIYCLNLFELNASSYYHLCKQTQHTFNLLNVGHINVERGMLLIASCKMSIKNLSSRANYNCGIWKAIIFFFIFRAYGPLIYLIITSFVLHWCLPASVNSTDHFT
jgi:hypothetical protein